MRTLTFYTAPWCTSCKAMKQFVDDVCLIANVLLEVVDVDAQPDRGNGISGLPHFSIQTPDGLLERTGAMSRSELKKFIDSAK